MKSARMAVVEGFGSIKVLVLHGWALDSSVWLATRALSNKRDFTWAYFDFPGYGVNRALPPSANIDEMAQAALTAAGDMGWTSFLVLGHSMGGATALRIATLMPDGVTGVVALTPVSPGGTPLDAPTLRAFDDAWSDPAAAIKTHLAPNMRDDDLRRLVDWNRASMDRTTWTSYLHNWTTPDFMAELDLFNGPVTLFHGESDPFVTPKYLAPTMRSLSRGKLEKIDGAGHYPMVEAPASTQAAVEQALRLSLL